MKKKFILLLFILISFIIQKGIVFAETANVSTEAQPTENYSNVSELPTMLSDRKLTRIETIDPYYIPVNGSFDMKDPVIKAYDQYGDEIPVRLLDAYWMYNKPIDKTKPGAHAGVGYNYNNGTPFVVRIKVAYKPTIQTKDSILSVGQKWNPEDNFVHATDEDGKDIPLYRILKSQDELNTSNPGVYQITYSYRSPIDYVKSSFLVTVEDKLSIETKNSTLYVGQKWNPKDNFVNATDEAGKSIPWEDPRITQNDASIDTSKPGEHKIKYTLQGKFKNVDSSFTVTVKEDKTKAELKDTELYVGQKWDLGSVFKNVIDKDGQPIKPEEVEWVWIDGKEKVREIDTSKPGKHTVKIAVRNAADKDYWVVSNEVTVTVKEEPLTIKQVPYFDFEDHILVSTNKSVVNKKEKPTIEVETPSINGKDWQLQVELSPFLDKKNNKSILKGVSLFIPKGKLESDLETEEPIQYDCQLEANGKASILMQGTKTKGKGRWKNKLATKEITLSIPPENKTGNYESTLHWTLLDVPG